MGGRGASSLTSKVDLSYRLAHRPGSPIEFPDEVATADKISSGDMFPSDFLDHVDWYVPLTYPGGDAAERETIKILNDIQGKPDAVVTIYRGAPKGELNQGDWVTLSKQYAEIYAGDGAYSDNPNSKVYAYKAKASELSFDGDSILEFGYWGKRQKSKNSL